MWTRGFYKAAGRRGGGQHGEPGCIQMTREAEGVTECREREGGGGDGGLSVQSVAGNHTAVADTSGLGLASLQ